MYNFRQPRLSTSKAVAKVHKYAYVPQHYAVHGVKATINEYFVAQAFDFLKFEYSFQVSFWGGHHLVGGQVLDFMVYRPYKIPVQVYGNYWHRGQMSAKDHFNEIQIMNMTGRMPIILWGDETDTFAEALAAVKKKVV